jgi:hypothetical protein
VRRGGSPVTATPIYQSIYLCHSTSALPAVVKVFRYSLNKQQGGYQTPLELFSCTYNPYQIGSSHANKFDLPYVFKICGKIRRGENCTGNHGVGRIALNCTALFLQ